MEPTPPPGTGVPPPPPIEPPTFYPPTQQRAFTTGEVLHRSSTLTEGHRWEIFFVLLVLFALAAGLGVAALCVGKLSKAVEIGLTLAVRVLGAGLSATAYTVMYYRLRSVKESLDVDQIASVFD